MVERSELERRTEEPRVERADEDRDYRGDETIVIPVPMQGEISARRPPSATDGLLATLKAARADVTAPF
jgi:hypothetical protein